MFNRNNLTLLFFLLFVYVFGLYTFYEFITKKNIDEINTNKKYDFFTEWIDDSVTNNIPKKRYFVKFDNKITKLFTSNTPSNVVIHGKNNWLFYAANNKDDTVKDYTGTNSFTEKNKMNALSYYQTLQTFCKNKEIEFISFIPPNKNNVYYRYMPDNYLKADFTRTDLLISYLQENSINIINPKQYLIDNSYDHVIYLPYDTHWNNIGGYLGIKYVLNKININIPELNSLTIKPFRIGAHDLAGVGNIDVKETDDSMDFLFEEFKNNYTDIDFDFGSFEIVGPFIKNNAQENKSILYIGDSYRMAICPVLTEFFKEVNVYYNGVWKWHTPEELNSIIEKVSPDLVIFECLERFSYLLTE